MSFFNRKKDKKEPEKKDPETAPTTAMPTSGDSLSYKIIRGPHVTEKASNQAVLGKYVFKVEDSANKIEIGRAIGKLYKVKVASVHLLRMPSKMRFVGKHRGEKAGFKKAIVTLEPGEKIDMN